jgi:hypothetical protein
MQVVCGSHKNLLAGQTVDPDGVVSLLKNNLTLGGGQIKKTSIISYESLMLQGAPTFRERTSDLEAAMVNTHPIDTKSSSLIRYCVTPVFDITTVAAVKPLLGFLLTGGERC